MSGIPHWEVTTALPRGLWTAPIEKIRADTRACRPNARSQKKGVLPTPSSVLVQAIAWMQPSDWCGAEGAE